MGASVTGGSEVSPDLLPTDCRRDPVGLRGRACKGWEDVNKSLYPVVLRGEQLPLKKGDNFCKEISPCVHFVHLVEMTSCI